MKPELKHLSIDCLIPTRDNPRVMREDQAFAELVESIRSLGILQPLIARPLANGDALGQAIASPKKAAKHGELYDLRAGHRRLAAAAAAGLHEVPVVVREMDDKTAMEVTVSENMQRENLSPLEESAGIQNLLDVGWKVAEIADRFGKPASWVARRARLRDLSEAWRVAIADPQTIVSRWTATLLEQIARLPESTQDGLLDKGDMNVSYGVFSSDVPTADELHRYLSSNVLRTLDGATWDLDDAMVDPVAGACSQCVKRSSCNPMLFDDLVEPKAKKPGQDRCLDERCYRGKSLAAAKAKVHELKAKHGSVVIATTSYPSDTTQKQLKEALGQKVHTQIYGYESAKASDAGAVPVVRIDPKTGRVGKTEYMIPPKKDKDSSAKKVTPPTRADAKEDLKERRGKQLVRLIQDELDGLRGKKKRVPEFNFEEVMALVLVFGTDPDDYVEQGWKSFDKFMKSGTTDLRQQMAKSAIAPLIDYLDGWNMNNKEQVDAAKRAAELFEVDVAKLEAKVLDEIPDPKGQAEPAKAAKGKATKKKASKK